jgi:hypothetical protein
MASRVPPWGKIPATRRDAMAGVASYGGETARMGSGPAPEGAGNDGITGRRAADARNRGITAQSPLGIRHKPQIEIERDFGILFLCLVVNFKRNLILILGYFGVFYVGLIIMAVK